MELKSSETLEALHRRMRESHWWEGSLPDILDLLVWLTTFLQDVAWIAVNFDNDIHPAKSSHLEVKLSWERCLMPQTQRRSRWRLSGKMYWTLVGARPWMAGVDFGSATKFGQGPLPCLQLNMFFLHVADCWRIWGPRVNRFMSLPHPILPGP